MKDKAIIINDLELTGNIIYHNKKYDKEYIVSCVDCMYKFLKNNRLIKSEMVIAIALPRNVDYIVADLMALKYGITFLNLDLSIPKERMEYMLDDSEVGMIITYSENNHMFNKYKDIYINIDGYLEKDYPSDVRIVETENLNTSAYILYTSGTTGRPKGVEVGRAALYNFFSSIPKCVDLAQCKVIASFTNQTFDIFFLETIFAILNGLDVVLGDDNEKTNPRKMIELLIKNSIDTLQLTPSKIKMLQAIDKKMTFLKNIKVLMLGGEPFPIELLSQFNKYSQLIVYNLYGPTETTIWSTVSNMTSKEYANIGKPIKNTQIYILDENRKNVSYGEEGEIAIGGIGLAIGYKNNKQLTDKKFIHLESGQRVYLTGDIGKYDDEGNLLCLGRKDNQVKVNGCRVELEEIDSTLYGFQDLKISLTCYSKEENRIITFYCAEREISNNEWFEFLSRYLPNYMLPNKFVRVDEVIYTSSGKKNRNAMLENYKNGVYNLINIGNKQNVSDQISNEIMAIINEVGDLNIIIDLQSKFSELLLDSIQFITIIVEVETKYDIEFEDEYMIYNKFLNIKEFVDYVKEKIAQED